MKFRNYFVIVRTNLELSDNEYFQAFQVKENETGYFSEEEWSLDGTKAKLFSEDNYPNCRAWLNSLEKDYERFSYRIELCRFEYRRNDVFDDTMGFLDDMKTLAIFYDSNEN